MTVYLQWEFLYQYDDIFSVKRDPAYADVFLSSVRRGYLSIPCKTTQWLFVTAFLNSLISSMWFYRTTAE